jgi:hypothetical protein
MSPTYDFIVRLAADQHMGKGSRLLDFGCGEGQIVDKATSAGFDAWGVDSYLGVWASGEVRGGGASSALPKASLCRLRMAGLTSWSQTK